MAKIALINSGNKSHYVSDYAASHATFPKTFCGKIASHIFDPVHDADKLWAHQYAPGTEEFCQTCLGAVQSAKLQGKEL